MKKISKMLLVIAAVLCLTACEDIIVVYESDKTTSKEKNNPKVESKEETNTKNEIKEEKKITLKIYEEEYLKKLEEILKYSSSNNKYYTSYHASERYPYIQITFSPNRRYKSDILKKEAQATAKNILLELQKYNYRKSKNIFAYNYEYINIYFGNYDERGIFNRNGGEFYQIKILDVNDINIEEFLKD